jgi:hypothetical protein
MRTQIRMGNRNRRWQLYFGLLVCLFVSPLCGCASKESANAGQEGQPPTRTIVRTFRIPPFFIEDHPNLRYDVPVKNDTGQTVRFSYVRRSCTCLGTVELECKELAPGQETVLHFDIDVSHRKGAQRFVSYLVEEGGGEWTYELETTLYERASFAEVGSLHFGMVNPKAEEVRQTEFRLYAESAASLSRKVTFYSNSDCLRIESEPSSDEHLPDGVMFRKIPLKIHLKAPAMPGLQNVSLHAQYAWGTEKRDVPTGVDWNVRTLVSITPSQAYFGTIDSSSPEHIERRVTLQSPDGRALRIKRVTTSRPEQVDCRIDGPHEGPTIRLLLALNTKSLKKPLWDEVVVEMDNALQPSVKIPVAALPKQTR